MSHHPDALKQETRKIDFALGNAFTRSPFAGNPAATVFLGSDCHADTETTWLQNIASTLNQPIATFIPPSLPVYDSAAARSLGTASVRVRWFTAAREVPLCGHGLLVAAHLLFSGARPHLVPPGTHTIQFDAVDGVVSARRVLNSDLDTDSLVEIALPLVHVLPIPEPESTRISRILARAFGRTPSEFDVRFIGCADEEGVRANFGSYLLVELGDGEKLRDAVVDMEILKETAPYIVNIFTSAPTPAASSSPPTTATTNPTYETRMFAPLASVPEDHVCGSANCLLAPYWANKLQIGSNDPEMHVRQVSKRGGDLWVRAIEKTGDLDIGEVMGGKEMESKVVLRGEVCVTARGTLCM